MNMVINMNQASKLNLRKHCNSSMKKILFLVSLFFLFLPAVAGAQTTVKPIDIYFFWQIGCPHCEKEQTFLDKMQDKYSDSVNIQRFEISKNEHNIKLLTDLGKRLNQDVKGVPFTAIFDLRDTTGQTKQAFEGFDNEDGIGKSIETYLDYLIYSKEIGNEITSTTQTAVVNSMSSVQLENFKIPFWGQINLKNISLPVVTVLIGLLDGFNPCAMWTLLFLIGLLLKMEDRRRRWLLGLLFIVSSGVVYFIFMAAWLQLILFLGMIFAIRIVIGSTGIVFGIINLRDFWKNRKNDALVCKVSKTDSSKKVLDRLRNVVYRQNLLWSIIGIVLLGFSVNLIEMACSAGFPAIYTQLLAQSGLSGWQKYLYMFVYIVFYMLDDIIVFSLAMITLQSRIVGVRFAKYSNLIGGLLILILGLLLIFKPAWIMFG